MSATRVLALIHSSRLPSRLVIPNHPSLRHLQTPHQALLQLPSSAPSTHKEFRDSLHNARNILTRYSETWTNLMDKGEALPEMIREQARSAVGKATLLLGKKLKHFEELLDQAENKTAIKDISINDLLGYWELMESQVNEVKNLFENIEGFKSERRVEVENRPG